MRVQDLTQPTLCQIVDKFLLCPIVQSNNLAAFSIEAISEFLDGEKLRIQHSQGNSYSDTQYAMDIFAALLFEIEKFQLDGTHYKPIQEVRKDCPHCKKGKVILLTHLSQKVAYSHSITGEYIRLVDGLSSLDLELRIEESTRHCAQAVLLSLALENELTYRLKPKLMACWPFLSSIAKMMGKHHDEKFIMDPELVSRIRMIADHYPQWLYRGRVPVDRIRESLRFILGVHVPAKYFPNLFEWGTLLLFFAQSDLNGFPLKKLLEMTGMSSAQVMETALLLFRVDHMRGKALVAAKQFVAEHFEVLISDTERILRTISMVVEEGEEGEERTQAA